MHSFTPPLRLVLIDRDPLALLGIRFLIEQKFPSLTICGQFHSAAAAEAQAEQHRPDVVVLDIEMDGGAAFSLPRRWRSAEDGPPCLVRLESESPAVLGAALRAGARGVIYRREPCDSFLVALTHVACGLPHLSTVAGPLLASGVAANALERTHDDLRELSPRERQIFRMLSQGQTTGRMATTLGCSIKTVQTHYAHIRRKLRLRDHAQLCRRAVLSAACQPAAVAAISALREIISAA